MKRRLRKVVNFFAFNLLFFALYLNFIHKDKPAIDVMPAQVSAPSESGTILVQNPEKYESNKENNFPAASTTKTEIR